MTMAAAQFGRMSHNPVSWGAACVNDTLVIKATVTEGWHLYGLDMPEGGPSATSFSFEGSTDAVIGECAATPQPETVNDEAFGMPVSSWSSDVEFKFPVRLHGDSPVIRIAIKYMCCNGTTCRPPATQTIVMPVQKIEK